MRDDPLSPSVVYRDGPMTARDYDEAIIALADARKQLAPDGRGCVVCGDTGHQAMECHHNPLLMARRAAHSQLEFRCYHCRELFSEEEAAIHFGPDQQSEAKCLPPAITALRRVLYTARDFLEDTSIDDHDEIMKKHVIELEEAVTAVLGEP